MRARGSDLRVRNSVFIHNHANRNGGCINAGNDSTVVIRDCIFEENTSANLGGALRLANVESVRVVDSLFLRNEAFDAGGIFGLDERQQSRLTVEGCTFRGNQAEAGSGALTLFGMEATVSGSSFRNNNGLNGGSLFFWNSNPKAAKASVM